MRMKRGFKSVDGGFRGRSVAQGLLYLYLPVVTFLHYKKNQGYGSSTTRSIIALAIMRYRYYTRNSTLHPT